MCTDKKEQRQRWEVTVRYPTSEILLLAKGKAAIISSHYYLRHRFCKTAVILDKDFCNLYLQFSPNHTGFITITHIIRTQIILKQRWSIQNNW